MSPVIDKSNREDGFSRKDFHYDAVRDCYLCPASCDLTTTGRAHNDDILVNLASVSLEANVLHARSCSSVQRPSELGNLRRGAFGVTVWWTPEAS